MQQSPAAEQTPVSSTQQPPVITPTPGAKAQAPAAAKQPAAPATPNTPAASTLTTVKDKTSYSIGFSIGKNVGRSLHDQSVDVDPATLARGVKDGLAGGETLMTDDEMKAILAELQKEARLKQEEMRKQQEELRKKQAEIAKAQGEANKKQGADFLAENKSKEGVVTLPSGLQYKILEAGTGPKPTANDTVVCNYRGTLIDGKEFDSSYKRGQPFTFSLRQVIKGWTEALQLMPVGSKWQLFVPSDLAYGERSMGTDITPNSTLIFEIELVSIKPPAPAAPPVPPAAPPAANPTAKPPDAAAPAKPADKPSAPDASTEKPKP
jgi:FKBP-type peptidyl-prolyl cis-trans isomerase